MGQAPDVRLSGVSRHWGGVATIKQVSLTLSAGERVALIGPSGGGKTTLIRLLAGVLRPTAGRIEVNGRAMADFSWRELQGYRSRCRIVEQQSQLVLQSTVHDNVVAGLLSTWPWYRALWAALVPVERERVAALLAQLFHETGRSGVALIRRLVDEVEFSGRREQLGSGLDIFIGQGTGDKPGAAVDERDATAVIGQPLNVQALLLARRHGDRFAAARWLKSQARVTLRHGQYNSSSITQKRNGRGRHDNCFRHRQGVDHRCRWTGSDRRGRR